MSLLQRALAAFLLIAASPLIALIAVLLALCQGRPVLFRQWRSGLGGEAFRLVKFRTMRDTRDATGALLPDRARVTAMGKFLRQSRLDELPSLWNVIRGELAFIGPRPLLPATIASLGEAGRQRGQVLPGLTGWSQVNGNTLLTLAEKVSLDLWYIDHRSIRTDMEIVARTVWVMTRGEKRSIAASACNIGRLSPTSVVHDYHMGEEPPP